MTLSNTDNHMRIHGLFDKHTNDLLEHELGFVVDSLTYHDKLGKDVAKLLSENYSITSLIVRTRSDRIVIHPSRGMVFLKEAKARPIPKQFILNPRFFIEASPLADHVRDSRDGEKCLYVLRIYHAGNENDIFMEKCFWASDIVEGKLNVSQICLGKKCPEILRKKFEREFGDSIYYDTSTIFNGSGDPYALFFDDELKKMKDLSEFIGDLRTEIGLERK